MIERSYTIIDSPIDPLTLVADDGVLSGLYMHEQRHYPSVDDLGIRRDAVVFDEVAEQLSQYFAAERTHFDLKTKATGNAFQTEVWNALCAIPYGQTVSYGELARRVGRPGAARVVGSANGRNPICIVVPCHRVVGATGDLVGYAGGLDRKQHLLDLEKAPAEPLAEQVFLF